MEISAWTLIFIIMGSAIVGLVLVSLLASAGRADADMEIIELRDTNKQLKEALTDEAWAYYYEMEFNKLLQKLIQLSQQTYWEQGEELSLANDTIVDQGRELGMLRDQINQKIKAKPNKKKSVKRKAS